MAQELQKCVSEVVLSPQTVTTSDQTQTANIDMRGYDAYTLIVNMSAEANTNAGNPTLSLLESDDTVVTNFATIVADVSPDLSNAHQHVYQVDMRGRKRYQRLSVTSGTAATNEEFEYGVTAIKYRADEQPASAAEMVASTNDGVTIV